MDLRSDFRKTDVFSKNMKGLEMGLQSIFKINWRFMLKNERFRDRFKSVFRKISNFKLKYE